MRAASCARRPTPPPKLPSAAARWPGPCALSAPVSFGSLHLGPALYPFLAANPEIDLTLELDDRFVDVAGDGYDAVVRHGPSRIPG